jgi:hypothetical protein
VDSWPRGVPISSGSAAVAVSGTPKRYLKFLACKRFGAHSMLLFFGTRNSM